MIVSLERSSPVISQSIHTNGAVERDSGIVASSLGDE